MNTKRDRVSFHIKITNNFHRHFNNLQILLILIHNLTYAKIRCHHNHNKILTKNYFHNNHDHQYYFVKYTNNVKDSGHINNTLRNNKNNTKTLIHVQVNTLLVI